MNNEDIMLNEIIKIRKNIEQNNKKMDELIEVLSFRNHLEKRNQLISSLEVYMEATPRVKKVIEANYDDFVEVCYRCYHEILEEGIKQYIEYTKNKENKEEKTKMSQKK